MFFNKKKNKEKEELIVAAEIIEEPIILAGVKISTNYKDVLKDSSWATKNYSAQKDKITNKLDPRVFITSTFNYDLSGKNYDFVLGDVVECKSNDLPKAISNVEIPAGKYLKITVKSKNKFYIGKDISDTKEKFYMEWLPNSEYRIAEDTFEFERHDERSLAKNPEVDVFVKIV